MGQLLLQMMIRKLLPAIPYQLVSVSPGLCRSNLGRDLQFPKAPSGIALGIWFLTTARSAEVDARNISHAIFADDSYEVSPSQVTSVRYASANGRSPRQYWSECQPKAAPSMFMASETGMEATELYWREMLAVLEKVSPGSTSWLKQYL